MRILKGKKTGKIFTRDIYLEDIRAVFFPKTFYEKYRYLGSVPWREEGPIFKAMEPLVIFMDYKAKPWWCPRWVLRYLYLFGCDNSIVRVRNRFLHDLQRKITKGCLIFDYKTKWADYDLRISVYGTEQMQELADAIEARYYEKGLRRDLADRIKELDPNTKADCGWTIGMLREELETLEDDREESEKS